MIRRAFTLMEILAVIVISSMITGMLSISLVAAEGQAAYCSAVALCRDLDARARLVARTQDSVVWLSVGTESNSFFLQLETFAGRCATASLPNNIGIHFERHQPISKIVFDRTGCSADYTIVLHIAEHARSWQVCGLTGLFVEGSSE